MLVYFGYTYCPDVSHYFEPTSPMRSTKSGAKADQIQPLFITVDPKRDTPGVVKQYAAAFSPRLVGLTGSPEQIAAAAKHTASIMPSTGQDQDRMTIRWIIARCCI